MHETKGPHFEVQVTRVREGEVQMEEKRKKPDRWTGAAQKANFRLGVKFSF